jgi:hypothetical protein
MLLVIYPKIMILDFICMYVSVSPIERYSLCLTCISIMLSISSQGLIIPRNIFQNYLEIILTVELIPNSILTE